MASAHPFVLAFVLFMAVALAGCHDQIAVRHDSPGSLPTLLTRSGWTQQDGINLTVLPEPLRFAAGEGTVVRHQVVNAGARSIHWHEGGCGAAWEYRIETVAGANVSWRDSLPECEEEIDRSQLRPDERVEGVFHWDGKDRSTDPPADAAPGHYRILVTFRYSDDEGVWRLLTADGLVAVR